MRTRFIATLSLFVLLNSSSPNPLAKLMRQMLMYLKAEKQLVEENKPRQQWPKNFLKISTAKVTPGKKLSSDHATYVQDFQQALKYYYEPTGNRREKFNRLVNTCIKCHQRECPGPISTIEQNLLQ